MESDHDHHHQHHQQPAISENPSDGEDQGATHVTSRSYECNFCRRGFSNAQALGGHMNIHRKDKAKLKQQQSSNQPSFDKLVPPQDQTKSGEERNTPKWNWNVSQEEHEHEHASSRGSHTRHQLPLFEESPTSSETVLKPQAQNTTEGALLSTRDSSLKLDLELRLGLEPQDSSPETGTRNFF